MCKKYLIIIAIFLLISPTLLASQISTRGEIEPNEEIINGRRFLWMMPNSSPPEEGYSVLFMLHGATQYADTWFLSGKGGFKGSYIWGKRQSNFAKEALEKGFLIIAPDSIRPFKIGPKAWDSQTEDYNQSKDLPFIQDILYWLDNSSVKINSSNIFCIGFSSGAFMTSRIAHYFGSQFKALAVHSGGNADSFKIENFRHIFDCNTEQNISENHPPTLIIHGGKDRLVPANAGINYYNDLLKAGIKSHLIINPNGLHIWQSSFNEKILDWFLFGSQAPSPPEQPTTGPGSSNYTHSKVTKTSYGKGANQFWIFEPADPIPQKAPLIVFNHGWGAIWPQIYQAWIDHIVKRGNIVIYPRYQRGLVIGFNSFSSNAINAVKNAIIELENEGHVTPDLNRFAITGHSLGGGITANMASRAEEEGLPIPKAMMPVQPFIAIDENADFNKISNSTYMLVIVGEDDTVVGNKSGKTIFYNTNNVPLSQKNFIIQVTDDYGYPILSSDHGAPTCQENNSIFPVDAMDYFSNWKLFDALTDFAFYGINSQYCFGNTSEQRYMGKWSDGKPVKELIVTDTP